MFVVVEFIQKELSHGVRNCQADQRSILPCWSSKRSSGISLISHHRHQRSSKSICSRRTAPEHHEILLGLSGLFIPVYTWYLQYIPAAADHSNRNKVDMNDVNRLENLDFGPDPTPCGRMWDSSSLFRNWMWLVVTQLSASCDRVPDQTLWHFVGCSRRDSEQNETHTFYPIHH